MSKFSFADKLNLCQLPTPIQKLQRLSLMGSAHQDVEIYVKRDDLTHSVASGNKIRKLELSLAEARRRGSRVVFTCGAVQSNHARATAALCRELGLECVLFLRREGAAEPDMTGNLLIDYICGASVRFISGEAYENIGKIFFDASEEFRKRDGKAPFLIPEGGSDDIGGLAYALAFEEIEGQCGTAGIPRRFDSVVVANGSGGTHAGLLVGRISCGAEDTKIVSFNVCRTALEMAERAKRVALGTIQRYRLPISLMPADIHVLDGYVGPGYGRAADELYDFIVTLAQAEGLLLDPVYTGKAMFGLLSELRKNAASARFFGNKILFVHTGGLPSLYAHQSHLAAAIARARSKGGAL